MHGRAIDIQAVRSGQATATTDMVVRGLTLTGSAGGANANLLGQGASLRLGADGVIRVEGALAIGGMADADRLTIQSGRRIEVATDAGGAIVLGGGDPATLGGVLVLDAPLIAAGSATLLEQLAANVNFAGRDALLATPAAKPRAEGYLSARTMDVTITDLFAVENSGSATLAGGFTAGTGGLTIHARGKEQPTPAQVSIWGRLQQAGGGFLTNAATIGGVTFDAVAGTFNPALVNGCQPGVPCRADDAPERPAEIATTVAAIDQILSTDVAEAMTMPEIRFVRLVDQDGLITEQLITEPVSGAGNASLWQGDDEGQGGTR
jgi:hypothetical protein